MNLANQLSLFRILLVPGIIACLVYYHPERDGLRYVALGLFTVAMVSDALDGLLARSQHQQSQLGALLDPIADKLLILSTLISCSVIHGLPPWMRLPAWFNLVVISRDAILIAGSIILFFVQGRWSGIQPNWLGKCTTVAQMSVIPTLLLGLPVKSPIIGLATCLTVLSGIGYIRQGIRLLG